MRTFALAHLCRGVVAARPRSMRTAAPAQRVTASMPAEPHAGPAAEHEVPAFAAGFAVYAALILCIALLA